MDNRERLVAEITVEKDMAIGNEAMVKKELTNKLAEMLLKEEKYFTQSKAPLDNQVIIRATVFVSDVPIVDRELRNYLASTGWWNANRLLFEKYLEENFINSLNKG